MKARLLTVTAATLLAMPLLGSSLGFARQSRYDIAVFDPERQTKAEASLVLTPRFRNPLPEPWGPVPTGLLDAVGLLSGHFANEMERRELSTRAEVFIGNREKWALALFSTELQLLDARDAGTQPLWLIPPELDSYASFEGIWHVGNLIDIRLHRKVLGNDSRLLCEALFQTPHGSYWIPCWAAGYPATLETLTVFHGCPLLQTLEEGEQQGEPVEFIDWTPSHIIVVPRRQVLEHGVKPRLIEIFQVRKADAAAISAGPWWLQNPRRIPGEKLTSYRPNPGTSPDRTLLELQQWYVGSTIKPRGYFRTCVARLARWKNAVLDDVHTYFGAFQQEKGQPF